MSDSIIYITPRLVLLHDLEQSQVIKQTHGKPKQSDQSSISQYCTNVVIQNVKVKNRGYPFSFKVIMQLCAQIQKYFYKGISNTAVFYSPDNQMGLCTIICYLYISGRFKDIKHVINYVLIKYQTNLPQRWLLNFQQFFDNMNIVAPPVKILKRVVLENSKQIIPIFQVFRQVRFQELQSVYQHPIVQALEQHQHHILKSNHHTKKPQSTYLFKPVIVSGDFQIDFYSYKQLKYQNIFSIGFNTLFVDTDTIVFQGSDLYNNKINDFNMRVIVQFEDYCECSAEVLHSNRCYHCTQELKNIKKQYSQLIDLSCQFNRNRKKDIASQLVFGNAKFDDIKA